MVIKKFTWVILIALLVAVFAVTSALAEHGDPVGDCPEQAFTLVHMMDHTDHMHQHIGVPEDLNADGYLCMKHLPNDLHLHVDNNLPLD